MKDCRKEIIKCTNIKSLAVTKKNSGGCSSPQTHKDRECDTVTKKPPFLGCITQSIVCKLGRNSHCSTLWKTDVKWLLHSAWLKKKGSLLSATF